MAEELNNDLDTNVFLLQKQKKEIVSFLFEKHGDFFYSFIYKAVNCTDLASKILTDSFVNIADQLEPFDSVPSTDKIFRWAFQIVRQNTYSIARNRRKEIGKKAINIDLEKMHNFDQELINLFLFKGYTINEVAQEIGFSERDIRIRTRLFIDELRNG